MLDSLLNLTPRKPLHRKELGKAMGLRVRDRQGKVHVVPDGCALEFVDDKGRIAVAVTQAPGGGSVKILTPGDPTFHAYCNLTGQKVSNVHVHAPEPAAKPLF